MDICTILGYFDWLFNIIESVLGFFGVTIDISELLGCDEEEV